MRQPEEAPGDRSRIVGGVSIVAGLAFVAGEVLNRAKPDIDYVACATGDAYLVNVIDLLRRPSWQAQTRASCDANEPSTPTRIVRS